jgi:hypothetical protein
MPTSRMRIAADRVSTGSSGAAQAHLKSPWRLSDPKYVAPKACSEFVVDPLLKCSMLDDAWKKK